MFDADYDNYKQELLDEAEDAWPDKQFVTKDSGKKALHADGVQRDTETGKPRFDLLIPEGVPFEEQLLTRVAWLYSRGADKYGARNWEKSETEETLAHHKAAFLRHVFKLYAGVDDGEDHAAAVVWNVNAIILTRRKIALKAEQGPSGQPWTPWQGPPSTTFPLPDIMSAPPTITPCEAPIDALKKLEAEPPVLDDELVKHLHGKGFGIQGWRDGEPVKLKENLVNPDYMPDPRNWEVREEDTNRPNTHVNFVLTGFTPVEKIQWKEGDELLETHGNAFRAAWLYSAYTDTWAYKQTGGEVYADSARSLGMIRKMFGPLKVTKGAYKGLVLGKDSVSYEPE